MTPSSSRPSSVLSQVSSTPEPPPRHIPLAIVLGLGICVVGGFATGHMLTNHPVFGVILMGVGWVSGFTARKITGSACRTVGYCLVAGCVLSFCLAMVSWYRWGITLPDEVNKGQRRDPTWQEAILGAPRVLIQGQAPVTLIISGICVAFGATEAFRQAGRRFRWVAVVEE